MQQQKKGRENVSRPKKVLQYIFFLPSSAHSNMATNISHRIHESFMSSSWHLLITQARWWVFCNHRAMEFLQRYNSKPSPFVGEKCINHVVECILTPFSLYGKRQQGKTNLKEKINQPVPPKMLSWKHYIHDHVRISTMHVKQQPWRSTGIWRPAEMAGPKKIQKTGGADGLKQGLIDQWICHVIYMANPSINHSSGEAWQRSGGWCRAWPSSPWETCSTSPSASSGFQPSSLLIW